MKPLTDTDLHANRMNLVARRSMDGKAFAAYCRKESRMERLRVVSAYAGLALIAAVALYAVCALVVVS